jgi:hypothetical protein
VFEMDKTITEKINGKIVECLNDFYMIVVKGNFIILKALEENTSDCLLNVLSLNEQRNVLNQVF